MVELQAFAGSSRVSGFGTSRRWARNRRPIASLLGHYGFPSTSVAFQNAIAGLVLE